MSEMDGQNGDVHARVEDYLNDKLQTAADLEQVDRLLGRVHEQQVLLREQLDEAREKHREAQTRLEQCTAELKSQAEAAQAKHVDLDRRLQQLAQTEVTDDAVAILDARMSKVRRLEIATRYLELLQELSGVKGEVEANLVAHNDVAVAAYVRLRTQSKKLQEAQPAAEGAAPQLLYAFNQQSQELYSTVKGVVEQNFRKNLEQMKWPGKDLNLLGDVRANWTQDARLLLQLQEPDLLAALGPGVSPMRDELNPIVLLPLQGMVQPLAARFRYHFYGEKPTNRLDRPEYFLNHVQDLIERHSSLVADLLGPILQERVDACEPLGYVYPEHTAAFITALLPMVEEKCLSFLPQITHQPQLLSHFMQELMSFDDSMLNNWGYEPVPNASSSWKGLTQKILIQHGYFDQWLTVEKDFALSRYRTIRDAADSGDIDRDAESGQAKPTKGAIRVNDLLETVTDRYRSLSSFSQKLKFLLDIQLSIFDDYHNYLHSGLQAYLVTSHTAGRLLQGQSEADAFGMKGLESLTKVFGSAEFLERKMSDWSDDIFFLDLWEELRYMATKNAGANASLGDGLKVDDVAAKTSTTIQPNASDADQDSDGSGLFDQTAAAYRRLAQRCEEEILRSLDVNIRAALRPYTKYAQWSSLTTSPGEDGALSPSAALDGLFQTASIVLGYLSEVLSPASMRRITRHFCSSVQRDLYDGVLMAHTFSASGALQFSCDVAAIQQNVEQHSKSRGAAGGSMTHLKEALFLLNLDANGLPQPAGHGNEDGWGFEDEDDDTTQEQEKHEPNGGGQTPSWGLWDAEKMIFESNNAARQALEAMELSRLSEGDARNILKRRVELNG